MYAVELVLPFFLLCREIQRIGLLGQIILQLTILASGNYGFFNLLTLCLCIPLIDDSMLSRISPKSTTAVPEPSKRRSAFHFIFVLFLLILFSSTTLGHLANDLKGNQIEKTMNFKIPGWIKSIQDESRFLRCFNSLRFISSHDHDPT